MLTNERGLSLLEVVASILLITIILISFFGMIIQSKKVGVASEEIIDATYLAQKTMEEMYKYVLNNKNLEGLANEPKLNEDYSVSCNNLKTLCYFENKENKNILITAKNIEEKSLVSIMTEVKRKERKSVVMETFWRWN